MQKLRALQLSFVAIVCVVFVEGLIGIIVNSLAILSDASHALFDAITMFILFLTTRMSLKPPDEDHMYGHAKIESIGGLMGGLSLIALAVFLLIEAALRLTPNAPHVHPDPIGFVAVFFTLGVDFFRMTVTRGAVLDENETSVTVKASFFHALADFASTVIALVGFGLAVLADFHQGDTIASIILCGFLIYLSVRLMNTSFFELSDAVPKELAEKIKREVLCVKGVVCCKELKVRRVGQKNYIEMTITAPSSMALEEAHELTSKIEKNVAEKFGDCSITIHVEPEKKK